MIKYMIQCNSNATKPVKSRVFEEIVKISSKHYQEHIQNYFM